MRAESSGGWETLGDGVLAERLPDAEEDAAAMAGAAYSSHVYWRKTLQKPGGLMSVVLAYFL